jgi:hypothetical protein
MRMKRGEKSTMMKRAVQLGALLALGAIGLVLAQVGSAGPRNCDVVTQTETIGDASLGSQALPGCDENVAPPVVNLPDGIFLCYSKSQTEPGVWMQDQAAELLAAGYYYPKALSGNVDGGTNLGSFHLVCNAGGTSTGMFVNANGEVVSAEYAGDSLGYYPQLS